jgi:hypothetical protein
MVPFLLFTIVSCMIAAYVASGHGFYRDTYTWAFVPSFYLDFKQFVGLQKFYSQIGQDIWIIGKVYPDVDHGYFVDIGSADAEIMSNSKALEEIGWDGICVDPFPTNWKDRKCQLFREVVYSRSGQVIRFRKAGDLGGIDSHIDTWKREVESAEVVELTTTTVGDILKRANAPPFIHYVSIDTEGSEMEILKTFPFSEYTVGAFTIEHNYEEPKRQQIRQFLQQQGYRFDKEQIVDDWYILADEDQRAALTAKTR